MKKILVLFVVFCFAQTIFCASNVVANKNQVQVTETNWGYEISNIENVEKFIFRNKAKSNAEIYIILGKENEFLDESEAIKFIKLLKQKDDGTNFYQPFHYYSSLYNHINWRISRKWKDSAYWESDGVSFKEITKFFIITKNGKIKDFKVDMKKKNFKLEILDFDTTVSSKIDELVEARKKAEEERLAAEEKAKAEKIEKAKIEEIRLQDLYLKSNREGYDNMPWDTSLESFLLLHPNAKKIENEGFIEKYCIEKNADGSRRVYKFYEGKLISGVSFFPIQDQTQGDDINLKLRELYGRYSDFKESSKHEIKTMFGYTFSYTESHALVIWNKSENFKLELDIAMFNGDTSEDQECVAMLISAYPLTMILTYVNTKKLSEVKAAEKLAEKKAQQQRMQNLGL